MFGLASEKKEELNIVVGCGRLGSSIATMLSRAGHDVVIVDMNASSFRKLPAEYSGFTLAGDATDIVFLSTTGIEKSKMVVTVTDDDNANIMIAQIAKKIFNTQTVIARLQDTDKDLLCNEFEILSIHPNTLSLEAFEQQFLSSSNNQDERLDYENDSANATNLAEAK